MDDNPRQSRAFLLAEIDRLKATVAELETALRAASDAPTGDLRSRSKAEQLKTFAPFAVENLSDGTYLISKDARLVYVNRAACRQLGYDEDEMLMMDMYAINPHLTPQIWDAVWEVTVNERTQAIETEHRTKDGRYLPVEILANAIEVDGVTYSCTFSRDITARRELEQRMRQAEKLEAIGQLAGGVAHDFNNQLAAIIGCADMLRSGLKDLPNLAQLADSILSAAMRSSDLSAQLLAFARKGKHRSVSVDLNHVVGEVVRMLQRSVDKRIALRTELYAEPAATRGDPTQLQTAVLNLAINARDAMPAGGELTFATEVVQLDEVPGKSPQPPIPGRYVRLGVTDTGTGMDAETQKRMFEPFFTTKEKGRGTGMGLSVVYGTVKSHHGVIDVHSEAGQGTRFDLYLPLVAAPPPAAAVVEEPQTPPELDACVLVVEDEEAVRDATMRMVTRLRCRAIGARSGKEAVSLYRGSYERIDVVLLDLMMPEMSGRDTFLKLREVNPEVVAILTSGFSMDGEVQTILDLGARAFLPKPFREADLARKIAEVLGKLRAS